MIENRDEQKEALEVLLGFNERLVKNMKLVAKELKDGRLDDSEAFLNDITQAMNWEIQVVNGTLDLLNEGKERLDKVRFNEKIQALSGAIASKDDKQMAETFLEAVSVFEELGAAAKEVVS